MKAIRFAVLYFAAVFAAGFILGTIRTLLVIPRIGELPAVLLELPVILAIAWIVCGWLMRGRSIGRTEAVAAGVLAFAILMTAEAALSVMLFGRTLAEYLASFTQLHGLLGLAGQVVFATFPYVRRDGG